MLRSSKYLLFHHDLVWVTNKSCPTNKWQLTTDTGVSAMTRLAQMLTWISSLQHMCLWCHSYQRNSGVSSYLVKSISLSERDTLRSASEWRHALQLMTDLMWCECHHSSCEGITPYSCFSAVTLWESYSKSQPSLSYTQIRCFTKNLIIRKLCIFYCMAW